MNKPKITKEQAVPMLETRFLNVYDLKYREDSHYYNATRRKREDIVALKSDREFQEMIPDAVTLCVILRIEEEYKLLLFYEYRYPIGRFLLSPPAGLIDPEDKTKDRETAIRNAATRELFEETGLEFHDTDIFRVMNPGVFSSPGMTDESNAVALLILNRPDLNTLTDRNSTGLELFNGFCFYSEEDARKCIKQGTDPQGNQYSVYTWQDLLYFVTGLWKEYL